jgi:hypothetical protein
MVLLPLLIGLEQPNPICQLSIANAQDNPCLAQEATISALQLEVLQAQSTSVALQSTVSAYELMNTSNPSPSETISSEVLFFDTFSDNSRGWSFGATEQGAASLSQGRLRLSANPDQTLTLQFPEPLLADEFYVQLDVIPDWVCSGWFGIGLTDPTRANPDKIFFVGTNATGLCAGDRNVRFNTGQNIDFRIRYERDSFWSEGGQIISVGLEFQGGLLSLYMNGEQTESIGISEYGEYLALAVESASPYYTSSTAFDNIEVRQRR